MVNTYRTVARRPARSAHMTPGAAGFVATAQRMPAPVVAAEQDVNNAGGFTFVMDKWAVLRRFLIMGTQGGTFYQNETTLTAAATANLLECIKEDGPRVVGMVVSVSQAGRAKSNDPALLALALAMSQGDARAKKVAFDALHSVARIGTHWLHLASFIDGQRGWGRGVKGAFKRMLASQPLEHVAYQMLKYANRDGWTMRDLLRTVHPNPGTDAARSAFYRYVVRGTIPGPDITDRVSSLRMVDGVEQVKVAANAAQVAGLVTRYSLPREVIPTAFQKADPANKAVWAALLADMGGTALVRNLNNLTLAGVVAPLSEGTAQVVAKLTDAEYIRRSRVHPLTILIAMKQYALGHSGDAGSGYRVMRHWSPVQQVVDALNTAFYLSFGNVPATGKRILFGLDVSGSMDFPVQGISNLTCREAAAALALVTANAESQFAIGGFTGSSYPRSVGGSTWNREVWHAMQVERMNADVDNVNGFEMLSISPSQRLDGVVEYIKRQRLGPTDCALPMLYARKHNIVADTFVIVTDSETWHGAIHPFQALELYRRDVNPEARLAVLALTATGNSLANPQDSGMLDLPGFDTATPGILAEFMAGNI